MANLVERRVLGRDHKFRRRANGEQHHREAREGGHGRMLFECIPQVSSGEVLARSCVNLNGRQCAQPVVPGDRARSTHVTADQKRAASTINYRSSIFTRLLASRCIERGVVAHVGPGITCGHRSMRIHRRIARRSPWAPLAVHHPQVGARSATCGNRRGEKCKERGFGWVHAQSMRVFCCGNNEKRRSYAYIRSRVPMPRR